MKLISARVTNFRSIDDSGEVEIDESVTCLVGKNESGKTAFMKALYNLSPVNEEKGKFIIEDYPIKGYQKYKLLHEKTPAIVVRAVFELEDEDVSEVESELGKGVFASKQIVVTKNYKNVRNVEVNLNEATAINNILASVPLNDTVREQIAGISAFLDFVDAVGKLESTEPTIKPLREVLKDKYANDLKLFITNNYIYKLLPRFVYFDDYYSMDSDLPIQYLKERREKENGKHLTNSERTALSLLDLAGTKLEDFQNPKNYERLKRDLEAASITITDEFFEFWTQNKLLDVEFDIFNADPDAKPPLNSGQVLHIRIKSGKHRASVSFDEQSKGFKWFFSFIAYFSQLRGSGHKLIMLLDEPGLSLHAKAQSDLLDYFDERLSIDQQVIYTTHSPFMVDPTKFNRIRTVQDVDGKGTVISGDILKNDQDTVFPLQAALGYELAQTLFVGPNCLLVEGPSDLIYLQILSELAYSKQKTGLDSRWVTVPVGGSGKVSTFISLLGAHKLNTVVLIDIDSKDMQTVENLRKNALLKERSLIHMGQIIGSKNADIEDLFNPEFYLRLVNGAYATQLKEPLTIEKLGEGHPRIVKRIKKYFKNNDIANGYFNHYKPAAYLLREQVTLTKEIDGRTVEHADSLFNQINELLE